MYPQTKSRAPLSMVATYSAFHCGGWPLSAKRHARQGTSGLVAMTSASHAEGRQFDPGLMYLMLELDHDMLNHLPSDKQLCVFGFWSPAQQRSRYKSTARRFEPLRAEPNRFLVHHLNHSVTLSMSKVCKHLAHLSCSQSGCKAHAPQRVLTRRALWVLSLIHI